MSYVQTIFSETYSLGIPNFRHDDKYKGRYTQGLNVKWMTWDIVLQGYLYILNNIDECQPYLSTHKSLTNEK